MFPENPNQRMHGSIYSRPSEGREQNDQVRDSVAEARRKAREAMMRDPEVVIMELDGEEPSGF